MLSRIAENLYWMGRYLERAENTARMIDVNYYAVAQAPVEGLAEEWWARLLEANEVFGIDTSENSVVNWMAFDLENPSSVRSCVSLTRENARTTQLHLNGEIWEEVNNLYNACYFDTHLVVAQDKLHEYFVQIRQSSHLIAGIAELTLSRDLGFYFLRLGRYLERTDNMLRILKAFVDRGDISDDSVVQNHFNRSLLRSVGAFEAYRKIHSTNLESHQIAQFLLTNIGFPRSVRFGLEGLKRACEAVRRMSDGIGSDVVRRSGKLASILEYSENANQILIKKNPGLEHILTDLSEIHNDLNRLFFGWDFLEQAS